ncbi:MAG: hypothetical protein HY801_15355, partial [Candidatus Lindowbacteria bacterium]|nr:hypothetical protein [Candidatus Lindowbacteria bacterium]
MVRKNDAWYIVILTVVLMAATGVACAAEHPKAGTAEHPKAKAKSELTKEDLAKGIKSFTENDAKMRGGYFLVYDDVDKKALALTLDKVHEERLAKIAQDVYFACADFKGLDGTKYDVDIFMMGPDKDHLTATDIKIHKVAGKERYTWYEEGGVWKRKSASATPKAAEPPATHEHAK